MNGDVWNDVAVRMRNAGIIRRDVDAATLWTNEYLPPTPEQTSP